MLWVLCFLSDLAVSFQGLPGLSFCANLDSAAMGDDLAGLGAVLGGGNPGTPPMTATGSRQGGSSEKRRKLRHYDLLPAQLLNSMGSSGVEHVALPQLWRSMCAGNKLCEAFSELCFDEPDRQGVGLSRFAEVMTTTIDRLLESPHYRVVLKPELWEAARAEARELLPAFKAICAGRGVADPTASSIRAVAYQRAADDPGDLTEHVDSILQWLNKQASPLRSLICLLSGGGVFYVAQCHEKGVRAWINTGGGGRAAMLRAVQARRPRAEAGGDDLEGLLLPA